MRLAMLAVGVVMATALSAEALVVKTWDGPGTPALINTSAPADDPGWANLATNRSAIYLGDHWVLAAEHAGGAGRLDIAGSSFPLISSSQSRLLGNPSTFAGKSIGGTSDVRIYRVGLDENGMSPEDLDPAIRQIEIADRLASTTNEDLVMFGRGRRRILNTSNEENGQFYFNSAGVVVSDPASSSYRGFQITSGNPQVWQWGTNRRAAATSISGITRSGSNVLIEDAVRDTIGFPTKFDEFSLDDEAQAAAGDSGGSVFWKDGDEWVLAGLMHVVYPANNNNDLWGAFGSHTVISDLSYTDYYDEIAALRAEDRYGKVGDVDLDGIVTGSIVNGVATGDLGILIDNWMDQSLEADIKSWVKGDLNQDSIVDLNDYALMRDALGGSISSQAFAQLLAAVSIPEPGAAALAAGGLLAIVLRRRG
ncbi:hypothetical protein MalM25_22530 [Planctomycetes bacterium MalM25]|nr:hypothetical protein MalM25_22530 [Planctomycetes bacterium MalM25]